MSAVPSKTASSGEIATTPTLPTTPVPNNAGSSSSSSGIPHPPAAPASSAPTQPSTLPKKYLESLHDKLEDMLTTISQIRTLAMQLFDVTPGLQSSPVELRKRHNQNIEVIMRTNTIVIKTLQALQIPDFPVVMEGPVFRMQAQLTTRYRSNERVGKRAFALNKLLEGHLSSHFSAQRKHHRAFERPSGLTPPPPPKRLRCNDFNLDAPFEHPPLSSKMLDFLQRVEQHGGELGFAVSSAYEAVPRASDPRVVVRLVCTGVFVAFVLCSVESPATAAASGSTAGSTVEGDEYLVIERINILGPQELGGVWEQSAFAVHRRLSVYANEAVNTFFQQPPQAHFQMLFKWFAFHKTLFSEPCKACQKLLCLDEERVLLPPVYRSMEGFAYHSQCRPGN